MAVHRRRRREQEDVGRWLVVVVVVVAGWMTVHVFHIAIPVAPPPSTFLPTPWPSSSPVLLRLHVPFPLPIALTVLFLLRYASRAIGDQGRSMLWKKPEEEVLLLLLLLLLMWRVDGGAYAAGDACIENEVVVDRH